MAAQWRVGVTVGETYNHYSIDTHYMTDLHFEDAWGKILTGKSSIPFGTLGIMGQYDVNEWFGIRADLNWTIKGYRQYRTLVTTDLETMNNYLLLPIMASFSVGGKNLRGFFNLGGYCGYWFNSTSQGSQYAITGVTGRWNNEFNNTRDQRFDCGLVSGVGVEWIFQLWKQKWVWHVVEAKLYYNMLSSQKDYMIIKDSRYNTTLVLQSGLNYSF